MPLLFTVYHKEKIKSIFLKKGVAISIIWVYTDIRKRERKPTGLRYKDMTTYTFKDGHKCTSNLNANEVINRMNRLSWLIVLTESYEDGEGKNICKKAVRAFNKKDNFTGIIKLTALEKDFLSYKLEDNDNEKDIDTINYYLK